MLFLTDQVPKKVLWAALQKKVVHRVAPRKCHTKGGMDKERCATGSTGEEHNCHILGIIAGIYVQESFILCVRHSEHSLCDTPRIELGLE